MAPRGCLLWAPGTSQETAVSNGHVFICLLASERPLNWGCRCTPDSTAASVASHASLLPCEPAPLVPAGTKPQPVVQCPFRSAPGGWTRTPLITAPHGVTSESQEEPREQLADGEAASAPAWRHTRPPPRQDAADYQDFCTFEGHLARCGTLRMGLHRVTASVTALRDPAVNGSPFPAALPHRLQTHDSRTAQAAASGRKRVLIPQPSSRRPILQDTPSARTQVLRHSCLPGQ